MFIETEGTPNPETIKFLPGRTVMEDGTADFKDGDDLSTSPLAQALFGIDGVKGVFLGADYVSVTKSGSDDWSGLQAQILAGMMQFFSSNAPVYTGDAQGTLSVEEDPEDADIIAQIRTLLDEKVRPSVAGDGGDIVFRGFKEGTVYLQMQGACSGCPSSTITLKHGIENLLRYYVPEVSAVEQVNL